MHVHVLLSTQQCLHMWQLYVGLLGRVLVGVIGQIGCGHWPD